MRNRKKKDFTVNTAGKQRNDQLLLAINRQNTFTTNEDSSHSLIGNKKAWNYFLDLLENSRFQNEIQLARLLFLGENIENDHRLKGLLDLNIRQICRAYALDEQKWSEVLRKYITNFEPPKPEDNLYTPCVVQRREEIGENEYPNGLLEPIELKPFAYSHPVIIRVSQYASKREILDFINKAYNPKIKPVQNSYIDKSIVLKKVRGKRKRERNDFIFKNKGFPRKIIAKLVLDEFGEFLDVGLIGKIISLEEKKRK